MRCIIIEDEIPAQKVIKNFLGKLPFIELTGVFNAAIEANSYLNMHTVDLVFLDINLPDMSGLDFIRTVKNPPSIIMTTAYPDYAVDSFELDTIVDYLVKPYSFDRFLRAVNKAKLRLQKTDEAVQDQSASETIFLNVDKTHHKIIVDDILYIESDRNYITISTKNKKLSYIESLKNWKERLPKDQFIQVHKSFIINKAYVDKISGNEIYVNNKRIPIGRTYKQELLKKLDIS